MSALCDLPDTSVCGSGGEGRVNIGVCGQGGHCGHKLWGTRLRWGVVECQVLAWGFLVVRRLGEGWLKWCPVPGCSVVAAVGCCTTCTSRAARHCCTLIAEAVFVKHPMYDLLSNNTAAHLYVLEVILPTSSDYLSHNPLVLWLCMACHVLLVACFMMAYL